MSLRVLEHALLEEIDVGILTADTLGNITFANRAACLLLGRTAEGPTTSAHAVFGLGHEARNLSVVGSRWTGVVTRETAGTMRELAVSITRPAVRDPAVDLLYVVRDVTEERALHVEMQRVARLAAMGTMVAGFAHEVRNPVASLRALSEGLTEELHERGLRLPHPARMLEVLARVERLVTTSLRFGRPSLPQRALHAPKVIAAAALATLAPRLVDAQPCLDIPNDLPRVFVDDGQLSQVLVILLNNAIDAAGSPSRVILRAVCQRNERERIRGRSEPPSGSVSVKFEVLDDGPGIRPELIERIFDPFYTTKSTGVGLGLSIAQQIVAENGASLEVTSNEGAPTVFTVTCPAELC